jgi:hypothetical protein
MSNSKKNPETERLGGPGSSHQNRKHPEKSKPRGDHPAAKTGGGERSAVSGGGGEADTHHSHSDVGKAGR